MQCDNLDITTQLIIAAAKIVSATSQEKAVDSMVEILKQFCWQVLDYTGDDELISSCNDEYWMCAENYVLTDGAIYMDAPRKAFSVRGASYVIVNHVFDGGIMRISLHVDRSKLIENFNQVIHALVSIPNLHDDMVYHITNIASVKLATAPKKSEKSDK